jgi:hypothetical protein
MTISRRGVLIGAGAAAVAVAGVPRTAQGDDAVLLARVAQFNDCYDTWRRGWARYSEHRAQIAAMPGCPPAEFGTFSEHITFLQTHDTSGYYEECSGLGEQTGEAVNAVFEIPAETVKGAFEKLKIVHIVVGNNHQDGDEDLDAYQDWDAPWMETVLADFERLAGGMQS